MFIDEEQWSRAYTAAKRQVDILYTQGLIDVPSGHAVNGVLHHAAVAIVTAALRAAAQDDEGDITDLPGVAAAQVRSHNAKYPPHTVRSPEK